jgi:hypothetical protein
MPVALTPRTVAPAKVEEAYRECWHVCPECHEDHMHEISFQGAKLDAYYKVCQACRKKKK